MRLLTLALLVSCAASSTPPIDRAQLEAMEAQAEKLSAGDIIEIKVFREPDLAGVYRVSRDGTIDFPLIGKVDIKDRGPDLVASDIRGRLADGYLKNPQVTVFVREAKSQKVHVLGHVSKPGSFPYEAGMTVIQAVTAAGGFEKLASKNSVKVTRIDVKAPFKVPVDDIRSGQAPNFLLQPGDIVYVPEALF